MLKNPTPDEIAEIINSSEHKAAKWIKDTSTGDVWYWPAEVRFHRDAAASVGVEDYEKGMAVLNQEAAR